MITLSVLGYGLGNQLFLYAFGRSMSTMYNDTIQIHYTEPIDHNATYENTLKHYPLKISNVLTHKQYHRYHFWQLLGLYAMNQSMLRKGNVNKLMLKMEYTYADFLKKHNIIINNDVENDKLVRSILPNKKYLVKGYFQIPYYAESIKNILQQEIKPWNRIELEQTETYKKIQENHSVAIHIRRGDYIDNSLHSVCNDMYYKLAIQKMNKLVKNAVYFVFSDDIEYVKQKMKLEQYGQIQYVSNGILQDYEELYFMNCCKYFIISNSSYSWWGQFLSSYPNKIVIAPERWYTDRVSKLYQDDWICLS